MNVVDIVILVCCIPAVVQGVCKGFIDQVIALLSVVLGAWLSFKFAEPVGDFLKEYIDIAPAIIHIIAFALIMLLVVFGLKLAGNALEKIVKFVMLGWLDKILGIAFALIKAALVLGLVAILICNLRTTFQLDSWKIFDESVLFGPLKETASTVFPYLKELIFKN